MEEGYCVECAEGPFPVEQLAVITWEEDPYVQTEDGDLVTICEVCRREDDRGEGE